MFVSWLLATLGLCFLLALVPLMIFLLIYFLFIRPFQYMGFSAAEAIIILFASLILSPNIFNIPLFMYNNWAIELNIGGALIPIVLSIYLLFKKKISAPKTIFGIAIVAIATYFVTFPRPESGIVSPFPWWLLPAFFASLVSVIVYRRNIRKAAPLAYISGTIGVLIGADVLHLYELISFQIEEKTVAAIGGAGIGDMVYFAGILAVIVDGILLFRRRKNER